MDDSLKSNTQDGFEVSQLDDVLLKLSPDGTITRQKPSAEWPAHLRSLALAIEKLQGDVTDLEFLAACVE